MAEHTSRRSEREELKRVFERALSAEPGVDAETAQRIVGRLMRRARRIAALAATPPRKAPPTRRNAPLPASLTPSSPAAPSAPPVAPTERLDDFDPFAFSAVVLLARAGRDALMERLTAIDRLDHLRKLAAAQHLGVDGTIADIAEVRAAILAAAERRLADRHAAAS